MRPRGGEGRLTDVGTGSRLAPLSTRRNGPRMLPRPVGAISRVRRYVVGVAAAGVPPLGTLTASNTSTQKSIRYRSPTLAKIR